MLDKAIELMGGEYLTHSQIVDDVTRKYGLSPEMVLTEQERRKETLDNLQIIMDALTDTQSKILMLTGQGYTVREMEDELGITNQACSKARSSIPTRLLKIADEKRIEEIESEIARLQAKGKTSDKSKKFKKLLDEYEKRISVREAMKKLLVLLTPPESTKEMNGSVNLPAYTFERKMEVGVGMREGIEEGYHVMKTITECHIPEYMQEQFGDKCTCCMLCTTCRRSKDVVGRKNGKGTGIWHTN